MAKYTFVSPAGNEYPTDSVLEANRLHGMGYAPKAAEQQQPTEESEVAGESSESETAEEPKKAEQPRRSRFARTVEGSDPGPSAF